MARRWDRLSWRQALLIGGFFIVVVPSFILAILLLNNIPAVARISRYFEIQFAAVVDANAPENPLVVFLSYLSALFMLVTIHELGHVAAGFAVGFRFERIRIGPIIFTKTPDRLKFTFQKAYGFDGVAAMKVLRLRKLRRRLGIYVAAGPLANLLSAVCVWAFLARQVLGAWQHPVGQFLLIFAALSVCMGIFNLIPFRRSNGMFTDGARLLSLVTSRVNTRRWLCIVALKMELDSGVRPRDWKRTWIAHSCSVRDQSLDAMRAFWMAYVASLDRGDTEQAARHLENCLELFRIASPEFKKSLLMEAAIFQAWSRNDQQKAKLWALRSDVSSAIPPLSQLRFTTCMHWAARDYDKVALAWEEGCRQIETLPPSSQKDLLRDSWLEWKQEIDTKRRALETLPESMHNI
ncbi:MAG: M50 family metallopeptidase [Candidatus Acidiferrales bacterium]